MDYRWTSGRQDTVLRERRLIGKEEVIHMSLNQLESIFANEEVICIELDCI